MINETLTSQKPLSIKRTQTYGTTDFHSMLTRAFSLMIYLSCAIHLEYMYSLFEDHFIICRLALSFYTALEEVSINPILNLVKHDLTIYLYFCTWESF